MTPEKPPKDPVGGDGPGAEETSFPRASKVGGGVAGKLKAFGSNRKVLKSVGVGGGVTILIVAAFFAIVSLKLEAVMKNIMAHEYQRVEDYSERRAERVAIRYLYRAVGSTAPEAIYADGSIMHSLYVNMRLNKFEDKLAKNHGLKLEKVPGEPRAIRIVTSDGSPPKNLKNEAEFTKYLEGGSVRGKEARRLIKLTVKEETRFYQVLKRHHFRRYLKNAYNIKRWSLKKDEDQKKQADLPEGVNPTEAEVQDVELTPIEAEAADAMVCTIDGDKCNDPNKRKAPDGSSPSTPREDRTKPSNDQTTDTGRSDAATAAQEGQKNAYQKLRESGRKAVTGTLDKIFGEVISKKIVEAVPIVGWVALAADIDHFFWNNGIDQIAVSAHSAQYVAVFATWATNADQAKEFKLSLAQFGALWTMLDGVEKSNAFHRAFMHDDGGTKLADDKKVGSDAFVGGPSGGIIQDCNFIGNFKNGVNEIARAEGLNANSFTAGYHLVAGATGLPGTGIPPWHCGLSVVRGAIHEAGSIIGDILGAIGIKGIFTWLVNASGKLVAAVIPGSVERLASGAMSWAFNGVFTPVITGLERGPSLIAAIDAGADVASNTFARDVLGGHNISNHLAVEQQNDAIAEQQDDLRHSDLVTRIFSTDNPQTVASQMIAMTPTGPQSATIVMNASLARIANPFGFFAELFTGKAHAAVTASGREPNGVQQIGYRKAELDSDLDHYPTADVAGPPNEDGSPSAPDGKIDSNDCPRIEDPNVANMCLIDTSTVEAMNSLYTKDDDGGISLGAGGSSAPATSATPGTTLVGGSAAALASEILANHKIHPIGRLVLDDLRAASNDQPASNGVKLSTILLQLIATMGKSHTFNITALESGGTGHSPGSAHYTGHAVDITGLDGDPIADTGIGRTANDIQLIKEISPILPTGSGFGQSKETRKNLPSSCGGATPPLPKGVIEFPDACNHLHITVGG